MILDGKVAAKAYKEILQKEVQILGKNGTRLKLVVFQIGDDEAAQSYLKARVKMGNDLGIEVQPINLTGLKNKQALIDEIVRCNNDPTVTGIMIDRPLPAEFNEGEIFSFIDANKDVDGCTYTNAGKLLQGIDCLAPSTAQAVVNLLKYYKVPLSGKRITVVGRSKTVGMPLAQLLIKENATVTICHSRTIALESECKKADILVVAMGKKKFIKPEFVSGNTTIIDVGIHNDDDGHLVGDVDRSVWEKVANYSPVPGGVGPLTNIALFQNVIKAYRR